MMKKSLLAAVALMALCAGAVQAQSKFTLKLGGSMPQGKFGDVKVRAEEPFDVDHASWGLLDNSKYGGAGLGFNLGVQWNLMEVTAVKGLDLVLSVDGFYNGLNSDLQDAFDLLEDLTEDGEYRRRDVTLHTPKYMNFPVMLGLNWGTGIAPSIGFFCEMGAGANLRVISNLSEEGTVEYYDGEETIDYVASFNTAVTFGFHAAAGLIFSDKYSVELGYYNLGTAKVKGEVDSGRRSAEFTAGKITSTFLALRLGIAL